MTAVPNDEFNDAEDAGDELDVNSVGGAILSYAETYKSVQAMILENIQNSLDANAKAIWVNINHKKRHISISDDGDGVDREGFRLALSSVGKSVKDRGSKKLGQFGRGFITPLGKCEHFTFTSQKKNSAGKPQNPYLRWTFITDEIVNSQEAPKIVPEKVDYVFGRNPKGKAKNMVRWRTCVEIFNFTKDRTRARIDIGKLVQDVLTEFREKMLENGTKIYLREERANGSVFQELVEAQLFQGVALADFELRDEYGFAKFEIYLSNRKGTKFVGTGIGIHEGNDPFAVPVSNFIKAVGDELPEEVVAAFKSGVFEGKIMCNHIELDPERTHFKENDGLTAFILKLIEWYEAVGQDYYESNSESLESERFRKNAEETLDALKKLLNEPEMRRYASILEKFMKPSGIGGAINDPAGDDVEHSGGTERNPDPGPAPTGGGGGGRPGGGSRHGDGNKPAIVTKVGLTFADTNEGTAPWYLEMESATIYINVAHHFYSMLYDLRAADKAIREYQKQIFFHVLAILEHEDPDEQAAAMLTLESVLRSFVVDITNR